MSNNIDDPSEEVLDLLVIGGGVMGLFTAYHAARQGRKVAVLERGTIGDPATASYGRTRSYRRDYLDALYTRLADEAITLWNDFETRTGSQVLVRCGCMNIADADVTPDLDATYSARSSGVLRDLGIPVTSYDTAGVQERYPYLRADLADLDPVAGLVNLPAVTAALLDALAAAGTQLHEKCTTTAIVPDGDLVRVSTDTGTHIARSLVITAGHGTNDVLALLPGPTLTIPLTKDRPSEARYFTPPTGTRHLYTSDVMPVIAYLDTGIYLHPIVEGLIDTIKIGYYNPPDLPRDATTIDSIARFIDQCLPGLKHATSTEVTDVDQCDYDLVADDHFVLGPHPAHPNIQIGVGWRGTGYKFAPWIGRVLSELATREGTVYDISAFDPARFATSPGSRPVGVD